MVEEKITELDLFQSSNQKIIFIENLFPNGGTRQFLKLLRLNNFKNKTTFYMIRRDFNSIKSVAGFIKDYLYSILHKPENTQIKLIFNPIHLKKNTLYISTSRRTLDFIIDVESPNHIHYFQHIEFWEYLNSDEFMKYCSESGYPSALFFAKLFKRENKLLNYNYKNKLPKINNFLTVSEFLSKILENLNKRNITLIKVIPHITHSNTCSKTYDLLLFYRASRFKGDDIVIDIINKYSNLYKIAVVAFNNNINKKITFNKNIFMYVRPSDVALGELYAKSRLVIHPSLSEGFGSIPQEALEHDCYVVSSKTGWLIEHESSEKVKIIEKHSFENYIYEIDKLLKHIDAKN